jgi:pyridoxal phosphate enzyme (YggS family)
MTSISNRLQAILSSIESAKKLAQADQTVQLLAVSKAQAAAAIREAYAAGQRQFGENYLQEALDKQAQLSDLAILWHFIGPIQSNKTQSIAQHFDWVHSVDRLKIAQRLNEARANSLTPLQVCVQINISNEASKSGVLVADLQATVAAIAKLPHLVRQCYDNLLALGYQLDTLSIGMSDDYAVAIEQGATIVRIGSALFGARAK